MDPVLGWYSSVATITGADLGPIQYQSQYAEQDGVNLDNPPAFEPNLTSGNVDLTNAPITPSMINPPGDSVAAYNQACMSSPVQFSSVPSAEDTYYDADQYTPPRVHLGSIDVPLTNLPDYMVPVARFDSGDYTQENWSKETDFTTQQGASSRSMEELRNSKDKVTSRMEWDGWA